MSRTNKGEREVEDTERDIERGERQMMMRERKRDKERTIEKCREGEKG